MTDSVGDTFRKATIGRYMFTLEVVATVTSVGDAPEGARFDVLYSPGQSTSAASTDYGLWKIDWSKRLADEGLRVPDGATLIDLRKAVAARVTKEQKIKVDGALPPVPPGIDVVAVDKLVSSLVSPAPKANPLWLGLDATLVSGSDWMLVRTDGVAELSGRMALRSTDEPDLALINVTITGAVDLNDGNPAPPATQLVTKVDAGLGIVLAATFEAGRTAPSWAPNGMKRQAAGFWKYERLTRSQFLAIGTVKRSAASAATDTDEQFTVLVNANVFEIRTP